SPQKRARVKIDGVEAVPVRHDGEHLLTPVGPGDQCGPHDAHEQTTQGVPAVVAPAVVDGQGDSVPVQGGDVPPHHGSLDLPAPGDIHAGPEGVGQVSCRGLASGGSPVQHGDPALVDDEVVGAEVTVDHRA